MVFCVVEKVFVEVGRKLRALFFGEFQESGLVESAGEFLHHVQGELAAFARFLDLLVSELFRRSGHELVIGNAPTLHQSIERLRSVVARGVLHGMGVDGGR